MEGMQEDTEALIAGGLTDTTVCPEYIGQSISWRTSLLPQQQQEVNQSLLAQVL